MNLNRETRKVEPKAPEPKPEPLTTQQRAERAWASQGRATVMLQDFEPGEIERLAAMVDENGKQADDFRDQFLAFYNEYAEARKAFLDGPEIEPTSFDKSLDNYLEVEKQTPKPKEDATP